MGGNAVEAKYRYLNSEPTSFKADGLDKPQLCRSYPGLSCPIRTGLARLGNQYQLGIGQFSEKQIAAAFEGLSVGKVHASNIRTLDADLDPVDAEGIVINCMIDKESVARSLSLKRGSVRIESPGCAVFIG